MCRKILHIIVVLGLIQGLASTYEARQLWREKVNLLDIINAGDMRAVCHKIVERGL